MSIRRILLSGAIVAALASVGIGVTAGAAQASPSTACARLVQQEIYYTTLGSNYSAEGSRLLLAGFPDAAQLLYNASAEAYAQADSYDNQWLRNCQVP